MFLREEPRLSYVYEMFYESIVFSFQKRIQNVIQHLFAKKPLSFRNASYPFPMISWTLDVRKVPPI